MRFEDLAERATLRCPWPEVSFALVLGATADVDLELTARAPAGSEGAGGVTVDGRDAGELRAGRRWTRSRLRLRSLSPGLHRLTLRWPDLPPGPEDPFLPVIERLELGLPAELHPVFGEVWSLVARPKTEAAKTF